VTYVPVGSNIPPLAVEPSGSSEDKVFTIAVFGVGSGGMEIREIADVARAVAEELGTLIVALLGRGSSEAGPLLRNLTGESAISLLVKGVTSVEGISTCLTRADALLFVRGEVSTRRGTVIAAIAHGLPVVGYGGRDSSWPITEAGLILGSVGDPAYLAKRLIELARDPSLSSSLRDRNRAAYRNYFSWDRIATTVEESLLCHR
jgi:glycosyltransferase involved in cell wall biosynthesis